MKIINIINYVLIVMNSTVKFNEELMNLIEKVRLNLVGITTDSLGAILTKLNSYQNPTNIVFNNIDELAKDQNPDFKIYYNHLPHLNDLKDNDFKINNQFIDCDITFKNILLNDENTYTYITSSKNLIKGRPKLPDLRVINGFEYNDIKIYYDNYMNFSIFIFDKKTKKSVNYYLQNNTVKFPIFCFYCSKARNLQINCFDYKNFKNNFIEDIYTFLQKGTDLSNIPTDIIKYFVNYFDKYIKVNIPKTRSLDTYKNYLCCYKYNLETLKCLRSMFEVIDKCNSQLVNEEDLKTLKETIETQSKLIKLNEDEIVKLKEENFNSVNDNEFLTNKLIKLSEDNDNIKENYELIYNNNDDLLVKNNDLKYRKKCLDYLILFLIIFLLVSIIFINSLEPDWNLYYEKLELYYNESLTYLNEIYNMNYSMYDEFDGYL